MSLLNGSNGHAEKLAVAKGKKEVGDKAFQASDFVTGESLISILKIVWLFKGCLLSQP